MNWILTLEKYKKYKILNLNQIDSLDEEIKISLSYGKN